MKTTWVLVADGARARLFETAPVERALTELDCYANPEGRAGTRGTTTERPPTVNESVGPARHSIEPHTTQREKVADRFAKSLRDVLERGRNEHRYEQLVLIAPPRFLGRLHANFSKELRNTLAGEIRRDFTELAADQICARLPPRLFH